MDQGYIKYTSLWFYRVLTEYYLHCLGDGHGFHDEC